MHQSFPILKWNFIKKEEEGNQEIDPNEQKSKETKLPKFN